ncbi:hypothetical protein HZU75_01640 [Chitinibacter fontanus]|uniref:Uncharacterized protein n=1 Tax=Chitinibacter fontanus TaxID=1737446 RepID=A0A7D5V7X1_9NEIS|nr:hypothetical protein [Chitinibacter fontanus]QLI80338.1 hypothetical protein HZU75_01640 [Chitinibacter fontanus]
MWRLCVLMMCLPVIGLASGGTPPSPLDWPNQREVLWYHSCGCADACWVAELRNRKNQQIKARLRCDCEQVFFRLGKQPEQQYASSCSAFSDENKFQEITRTLHELVQ